MNDRNDFGSAPASTDSMYPTPSATSFAATATLEAERPVTPLAPETAPDAADRPIRSAPTSGLALGALLSGIFALLLAWIPVLGGVLGVIGGVLALVLGAMALRRGQSTGMSVTGIVTGAIGLLTALGNLVLSMLFIGAMGIAMFGHYDVEYTATAGPGHATVTYDGDPANTATFDDSRQMSAEVATMDAASMTVTGATPTTPVSCTMSVNGGVMTTKTGTGTVTCEVDSWP